MSLMTSLGIDQLSAGDQLRLVNEILDNLADRPEPTLTEAQRNELDRRVALLDAGASKLSNWEEVEARVLGKLHK
jgi:putative addiction module component (TIGR02574 family)